MTLSGLHGVQWAGPQTVRASCYYQCCACGRLIEAGELHVIFLPVSIDDDAQRACERCAHAWANTGGAVLPRTNDGAA